MLNGMTVLRFENMPELARSGGKKTAQCTHCAMDRRHSTPVGVLVGSAFQWIEGTPHKWGVSGLSLSLYWWLGGA